MRRSIKRLSGKEEKIQSLQQARRGKGETQGVHCGEGGEKNNLEGSLGGSKQGGVRCSMEGVGGRGRH